MRRIEFAAVAYRCNVVNKLHGRYRIVRLTYRGKERFAVFPCLAYAFAVFSARDDTAHLSRQFYTRFFAETEFC